MFITYSLISTGVSVWYIDDIVYPKQAQELIHAIDKTAFITGGESIAIKTEVENILNKNPFNNVYSTINNGFSSGKQLKFDAILSLDEANDDPVAFLVYRSELDAYIFDLYEDYQTFKALQDVTAQDELINY